MKLKPVRHWLATGGVYPALETRRLEPDDQVRDHPPFGRRRARGANRAHPFRRFTTAGENARRIRPLPGLRCSARCCGQASRGFAAEDSKLVVLASAVRTTLRASWIT